MDKVDFPPKVDREMWQDHVWGETEKWQNPDIRHQLLIGGIPEGERYVAGSNNLDDCLNKDKTAFLQLFSGTYLLKINEQAERLANVLNHAGGKVEIMVYSAGAYVLAELLNKYPEYADKILCVEAINPSIGGESIRFSPMRGAYPDTDYIKSGYKKIMDRLKVTVSDRDEMVNSDYVAKQFDGITQVREGKHAIDAATVNQLFG